MKVYFVRHGESESNAQDIAASNAQDSTTGINESLTAKGVEQTKKLLETLDKDFDLIISSPMKRTMQTAEIISSALQKPLEVNKDIVERDFGLLSGRPWTENEEKYGARTLLHSALEIDFSPFGGETMDQV